MKHPDPTIQRTQDEFLALCPDESKAFHAQMLRLGNAAICYHQLALNGQVVTEEDFGVPPLKWGKPTPLRLDARLFDEPPPQPAGKRGPKPKIGPRQPTLQQRLAHSATQWQTIVIPQWYGKSNQVMQVATGTALWRPPRGIKVMTR